MQDNKCAICGKEFTKTRMVIDHNHITKLNRGLLCSLCNFALGALEENPVFFNSAIDYLKKWRTNEHTISM